MEKISRFIHVFDGEHLWHALEKRVIPASKNIIEYVEKNKENDFLENIPEEARNLGIITTLEDELAIIEGAKESTTDFQYQGLYLITSTMCNLDCDYCFYRSSISKSLKERKLMPYEIAKEAVDKFKDVVKDNVTYPGYWQQVTLYGGEPMCNKELLKRIIPYIHSQFDDEYTDIVINTNLTLLDDEMMAVLKENNVIVQVSIDGTRYIHDLHRKFIDGRGSYDIVIDNAKKLVKNGIKVIPMITATNANVDDFENIVLGILEELGVSDFNTNVIMSGTFEVDKQYFEKLAEAMVNLNEKILLKNGGEKCDFSQLCESIVGNNKVISKNSCGGTRKITVFPDGKVYACQALQKLDVNQMGDLSSDFAHSSNHELWKHRNRFNNEECLNCEVLGSCGGGCALGSYNSTGSIYGIDYNECQYNKCLYRVLKRKM